MAGDGGKGSERFPSGSAIAIEVFNREAVGHTRVGHMVQQVCNAVERPHGRGLMRPAIFRSRREMHRPDGTTNHRRPRRRAEPSAAATRNSVEVLSRSAAFYAL